MSKPLIYVLGAAVLTAGAFVGTSRVVGGVVANEVAAFEASLAAMDNVQVNRLDYSRRLFDGTLDYDLVIRVLPDDPLYPELQELVGAAVDTGLRIDGRFAVKHGPWLGDGAGFGLARATGGMALPEALRSALPNYPGQRPLIEASAEMNMSRDVEMHLKGTDYRGRVVAPDASGSGNLVFAGLDARAVFGSALDAVRWSIRLDELSFEVAADERTASALRDIALRGDLRRQGPAWRGSVEAGLGGWTLESDEADASLGETRLRAELAVRKASDGKDRQAMKADGSIASLGIQLKGSDTGEVRIGRMRVEGDALREWRSLWTGTGEFGVEGMKVAGEGYVTEVASLAARSNTVARDGVVDQTVEFDIGAITINGLVLGKGRMHTVASGFDGEGLDALLGVLERVGYDEAGFSRPDVQEGLQSSLERILSRQPAIAIDPLGFEFKQPDDATARLVVRFKGEPGLNLDNPFALIERLEVDAGFAMTFDAMRELLRIGLEVESLAAREAGEPVRTDEDIAREVAERFDGLMAMAGQVPYLQVGSDRVSMAGSFRNGQLTINGESVDDATGLAALGGLSGLFGGDDMPSAPGGVTPELDWTTPGMFGNVSLSAGFDPDPNMVSVMAGGPVWLEHELGWECVGHVNAAQPDVVLDYTAGDWPLYIYAESQEDTTLIVRAPDGEWYCSDDDRGLDPGLTFETPDSGRYAIWIGTYTEAGAQTTLSISELEP
jgi:hypothetical protein